MLKTSLEEELVMVDSTPVTTKREGTRFRLRSIREIAEKYGGVVTLNTKEYFKLNLLDEKTVNY